MKKILGVIFLSLLLSGNAYAKSIKIVSKNSDSIIFKVKKGMSTNWGADESKKDKNKSYVTSTAKQHCKSVSKKMFIFGGSAFNASLQENFFILDEEIGGLFSFRVRFICANSLEEALNTFNSQRNFSVRINGDNWTTKYSTTDWKESSFKKINKSSNSTQSNTASTTSGSSSMSMKDKITQAKQVCTDLGFQQKTEKHADCSMQMMSIQFETTNKVASASGGTTQEVIVTHRNDYDIWDALLDFSAAIDPKNQSTSSSSSNRGTNCVVGRTNPTFGTTTINCR